MYGRDDSCILVKSNDIFLTLVSVNINTGIKSITIECKLS